METTTGLKNELAATRAELEREKEMCRELSRRWMQAINERKQAEERYNKAKKAIVIIFFIALSAMLSKILFL